MHFLVITRQRKWFARDHCMTILKSAESLLLKGSTFTKDLERVGDVENFYSS